MGAALNGAYTVNGPIMVVGQVIPRALREKPFPASFENSNWPLSCYCVEKNPLLFQFSEERLTMNMDTNQDEVLSSLSEFVPGGCSVINMPTWKLRVHPEDHCLEIVKERVFNKATIIVGGFLVSFCVLVAISGYLYSDVLPKEVSFILIYPVGIGMGTLFCIAFPLISLYTIYDGCRHYGKIRVRFDPLSGEIFFPHENVSYKKADYREVRLGYVIGFDTRGWHKLGGIILRDAPSGSQIPLTQMFVLIQDADGVWTRYTIACEMVESLVTKAVKLLAEEMNCKIVTRKMNAQESFVTQEKYRQ